MLVQGCSTEKNTGITRSYHNVTTRYNVLFNARESYKSAIRRAEQNIRYDYTQILPLFLYGDNSVAMMITGDMETAATKATKAINFHSIKVKPKVGKGVMTPSQRKFYDKREFNKHMDECYLIIGKAYVYTNDYFLALQTFNFMETEFPDEESIYEARVWRAKALIMDKNLPEAGRLLNELLEEPLFPKNKALRAELYATVADWNIKQNNYANAINYLNIAIDNTRHKRTLMRYRYVLAQLHLEQGDYVQASNIFKKIIRMNPPYEMAFNATISLATASKGGGSDIAEVKKQLNKMLRDSKNLEYQDQIYYSLAEIELHEGNTEKAIEYYQKSAQASTMNIPQKIRSYLTLGNLFYERRQYIPAQAYYDSAMINIQPDYPGYIQISARARNLDVLVHNLNTVHFQDSVQRIARMSETERNRLISNIIAELRLREQREKEAETIRQQQYYSNIGRRSSLPDATTRSQWYFYNPAMVTQGINEFETRWGRRNLEDNWRRINKGTSEMLIADDDTDLEEQAASSRIQDIYTPEYYLQDVPLTDSMMTVSLRMIEESLYAAGYIYNNDFQEYALAAEQYEDLIRRFPQSDYVTPSYYYLYQLYSMMGRSIDSEKNKNLLLTTAPESVFAKILVDPDYLEKLAMQTNETEELYERAYSLFNSGEFQEAIKIAADAMERFPNDALAKQFDFLKALSTGRHAETNEAMRDEMRRITNEYPRTEIATLAQNLIDLIDDVAPELKQAEQIERVKALYTYNEEEIHHFAWRVDSRESMNQLWYDLQLFSTEFFINDRLFIERLDMDARNVLLMMKGFADFQRVREFYLKFISEPEYQKNARYENFVFMISESNFTIMDTESNIDEYIEFFKNEYE